jgi:hypothetical protein
MDLLLLLVAAWNMVERPTNLELVGAWTMVLAAAEARIRRPTEAEAWCGAWSGVGGRSIVNAGTNDR